MPTFISSDERGDKCTLPPVSRMAKSRIVATTLQYSDSLDPDLVRISEDIYDEINPTMSRSEKASLIVDGDLYVALRSINHASSNWIIFKAQLDSKLPPSTCSILPSYNSLLFTSSVFLRRTNPLIIDHVVLSCYNDTYEEAQREVSTGHGEILRRLGLVESGAMVRKNWYYQHLGFKIRECQPVDQGLMSRSNTKITIVRELDSGVPVQANGIHAEEDLIDMEISTFLTFDQSNDVSVEFDIVPLTTPIQFDSLTPRPGVHDDSESMAYIRVEQLAKIGCFSGDFVLIESTKSKRRIRLFSYPEPNTIASNTIFVSPLILHNLGQPNRVRVSKIRGSKDIETASEVTISRVASAVTTDRGLQATFLSGLRSYFENCHRVVKNNDLIAIPIDTVVGQMLYNPGGTTDDIDVPYDGVIPSGNPNDIAWFKITSLASDDEEFVIDPVHTRMVQTGLVTCPLPSDKLKWREYLSHESYPDFISTTDEDFSHAKKIKRLISASLSDDNKNVSLNMTMLLHSSKRGSGKATIIRSIASQMGIHLFEIDCYNIIGENDVKTLGMLQARLDRASTISPCIVLLRYLDAIAKKSSQDMNDGGIITNLVDVFTEYCEQDDKKFILVATVSDEDKLSESIRSRFKFEIQIGVPTESERRKIFSYLVSQKQMMSVNQLNGFELKQIQIGYELGSEVSINSLALQSAGLVPPDLESIVEMAKLNSIKQIHKTLSKQQRLDPKIDFNDVIIGYGGKVKLRIEDLSSAISLARTKYSDSIGAPRIPNVSWKDVGGLEGVKKEILDTIEMPLKYPHLFNKGMKKRSGILFYGPPGTGKTLLAKAIATTFSLNFFSVKGPELLNMYIGESEANVRKVFQRARDAKPCVVFFDELDSVAPKRGNQGDSGGVMDRIVSQLLAELDGMSGQGGDGVFVVGATNRPDLLDEALLRPGRFDKLLYLGISDTHDKQRTILEALTRKFSLAPDVSLKEVSQNCPFTYTGADFYALCSDAILNAMIRTAGLVDEKVKKFNMDREIKSQQPVSTRWWFQNVATDEDINVQVSLADFSKAKRELIPSVSADELRHYLRVRENFEGKKKENKQVEEVVPNDIPIPGNGAEKTDLSPDGLINGSLSSLPSTNGIPLQSSGNGSGKSRGKSKDTGKGKGKGKQKLVE